MSNLLDFGYVLNCTVCTDASAAIGIVHRMGLGRTRHIDVQYLWIQSEVQSKAVRVVKVGTADNPADVLTKNLNAETMSKHMRAMQCRADAGRASKAPQLNEMAEVDDYWEMVPGKWSDDSNDWEDHLAVKHFKSVHARDASALFPRNCDEVVRTEAVGAQLEGQRISSPEAVGWTRRHAKPRAALFTPMKVAGGPRNGLSVGEVRMTMGQYVGGGTFKRADLWKDLEDAHSLRPESWTGYTRFMTKKEFSEWLPSVSTRRVSN